MAGSGVWAQMTPFHQLGVKQQPPDAAATSTTPGIARSAGPGLDDSMPFFHPDNPLFWFGALAAVTFGLVGISTSARLGPFKASAAAGKS